MIKKVPMRMCLGCGELKSKRELIRVVKNKEDEISIDFTGKKPGRGAYICNNSECLKKAQKTRKFERTFECTIDQEVYEQLIKEIEKANE